MMSKRWMITDGIYSGAFDSAIEQWDKWRADAQGRYVCFANVHMTVEGLMDEKFSSVLQQADMICADGQPVVWLDRWWRRNRTQRISGMDALPKMLEVANERNIPCYFYGGSPEMLEKLDKWVKHQLPQLSFEMYAPPFGPLDQMDFDQETQRLGDTLGKWIFVILGCPKQEQWMNQMRNRITGVMFGVGGALPVMLGMQSRAPYWMQKVGLEWLYRLIQEPRRMWRRYLVTNLYFIGWVLKLLLMGNRKPSND